MSQQLVQKEEGTVLVLTEGLDQMELQHRVVGVDGERRRMDGVWEEAATGVLRAPGLHESMRDVPAEVLLGQGGSVIAGCEELRRRPGLPMAALR